MEISRRYCRAAHGTCASAAKIRPPLPDFSIARAWLPGAATSSVQDELADRIDKSTSDQEQHRPYQKVDLLLEIGHGLRSFQLPRKDGSQEENDGYCRQ